MAQLNRRTIITPTKHHACTSQNVVPSLVLLSIGMTELQAYSSIRISMVRFTTKQEINYAADVIITAVTDIKNMSKM